MTPKQGECRLMYYPPSTKPGAGGRDGGAEGGASGRLQTGGLLPTRWVLGTELASLAVHPLSKGTVFSSPTLGSCPLPPFSPHYLPMPTPTPARGSDVPMSSGRQAAASLISYFKCSGGDCDPHCPVYALAVPGRSTLGPLAKACVEWTTHPPGTQVPGRGCHAAERHEAWD